MSELKRWSVKTRVTVERWYSVEAVDEKAAIEASVDAMPTYEEESGEETLLVVHDPGRPVPPHGSGP